MTWLLIWFVCCTTALIFRILYLQQQASELRIQLSDRTFDLTVMTKERDHWIQRVESDSERIKTIKRLGIRAANQLLPQDLKYLNKSFIELIKEATQVHE